MTSNTKTVSLTPCPFYGSEAKSDNGFSPCESVTYAWCSNQDCSLCTIEFGFTVEEWNGRATPTPQADVAPINDAQVSAALAAFNAFPCPMNGCISRSSNAEQMRAALVAAIAAGGAQEPVSQTQIDALIAEHSEWTPQGSAIVDSHRRAFAKALVDLYAAPIPREVATVALTDEQMMAAIKSVCGFDAEKAEQWRPEALTIGRAVERALLAASNGEQ